jgi:DNA-binding MarR family transcriptional regulator
MGRLLQRWRHQRRRVFRDPVFSNPGWDILLDLFLAAADGRPLSVKAACLAATVSKTTGLRYLRRLDELGLVIRAPHPTDHRSSQMALTDEGLRHMQTYLARLAL